ncbi:MAG: PH domain-containing protein [Methanobacteriaceae archaeon]|nr:PH domain-containing protein [Methanobacteriaceae archaeon]
MIGKDRTEYHTREKVLFETKPNFFIGTKSALIKVIIIILILYFSGTIIQLAVRLQNNIINMIQIPLVQWITIILYLIIFLLVIWVIWNLLAWNSTIYKLTNYRVIVKKGLIRKSKAFIHYEKIQDINITQTIMEKIFSSGDILIFGGHENTRIIMENVPNPDKVENMINDLIEGDYYGFEDEESRMIKSKPQSKRPIMERHSKKFKR